MYDDTVKEGKFLNRKNLELSKELWNKNILIVGFGRVGKNLIKKCIGFDMNVFVYDPYVDDKTINSFGGKKANDLQRKRDAKYSVEDENKYFNKIKDIFKNTNLTNLK